MNIIPVTYCNIARFINGSLKDDEPNVSSLRCVVGKEVCVLLFANRKIKKEEELIYNYGDKYFKKRKK